MYETKQPKELHPHFGGAFSESLLLLQVDQSLRDKSWQAGGKKWVEMEGEGSCCVLSSSVCDLGSNCQQ